MRYQKFSFDIYQVLSYRERKLALLILKIFWNYFQVAKHWITCKCHLRVKFFAWMFKFLSECLLYETMVELLGELTSPLLLLHGTDYDCLHNQERNMSNTGRDTHSLTQVLCPQSLSILFNSRRVFWHVNISLLCPGGKKPTCGRDFISLVLMVHFRQYSTGWVILDLFI